VIDSHLFLTPQVNSESLTETFRSAQPRHKCIGSGLYIVSAYVGVFLRLTLCDPLIPLFTIKIRHACDPSAQVEFKSGTNKLHLVATRDIKKGEEITMSYVENSMKDGDTEEETARRRKALLEGWKFACNCSKCTLDGAEEVHDGTKLEATYSRHLEEGIYS
jgi:hypothetical protein